MGEDFVKNIDVGPGKTTFGTDYLGRTSGETQFSYNIDTHVIETEEDGPVDELITNDPLTVTVPMMETDIDHLATVIPWAEKAGDDLHIGKAIGIRLFQYADELVIEPLHPVEGAKKIVVHKAYPKPGPVNFGYSRTGERVAEIQFVAIRDTTKSEGEDYFSLEPAETPESPLISTNHTVAVGDDDPALVLTLTGDDFDDAADVENTTNWTFEAGATGLSLVSVHKTGDREVVVVTSDDGTGAKEGTFSIQANDEALSGTDPSNVLSVTVS